MEEQCCHLQTLRIEASLFGKISPCTGVMLSCILSFITIPNAFVEYTVPLAKAGEFETMLEDHLWHTWGRHCAITVLWSSDHSTGKLAEHTGEDKKFIFIKGIKVQLKSPYKYWTVHGTENCIRENSAHWLIYQNYSKSAISRKGSLLENCLRWNREGQDWVIHKRTFTPKKYDFSGTL